ncbi:mitochondrial carrier protein-like protein [Tribonema minus]|uniref:Mitochondrial carrier protein-like protein n=1 Tax=Tribonema minus TaxID=303371 RepID=A0A836CFD2_9STRA|nr:mitochondrial carrier protein-like protein [Tribonema minus]
MALAGAMAGAISTVTLHPIDTAKTLRQSNPQAFKGTIQALSHMLKTHGPGSIYAGVGAAVVGSMPSSALYFGAYESVKARLTRAAGRRWGGGSAQLVLPPGVRAGVHVISAACGNAASSLVFVPKEYVKQSLQAQKGAAMRGQATLNAVALVKATLRQQGIRGLYRGYWATLSRNVPSAILRFTLYEEIKLHLRPNLANMPGKLSPAFLLAGAVAGAVASGLTTPFDVVKTQVATGRLDRNLGVIKSLTKLGREGGIRGLYVGAQPRMLLSSLFTAVGFGSFEAMKTLLQVDDHPLP